MDEQVVPTFSLDATVPQLDHYSTSTKKSIVKSLKSSSTKHNAKKHVLKAVKDEVKLQNTIEHTVPTIITTPERKTNNDDNEEDNNKKLVASEYIGKLRWQTPRRTGKWKEAWHSAVQLCPHKLYSPISIQSSISMILRNTLSKAIVTYVGPLLSSATVNKWLCLLCEYLELNTDEEILVICLLRRYSKAGGQFVTMNDWMRPQKWECVVAIACYLSVLLTEEFPGKTILDLKELLGSDFKFGQEQIQFLKCIDWRICIASEEIKDILNCCKRCIEGDMKAYAEMDKWFSAQTRDVSDAKLWNEKEKKKEVKDSQVIEEEGDKGLKNNSKKRGYNYVSNNNVDDRVVPQYVIRRIDPSLNMNAAFIYHPHAHAMMHQPPMFLPPPHPLQLNAHAHAAALAAAATIPMWPAGANPPAPGAWQ